MLSTGQPQFVEKRIDQKISVVIILRLDKKTLVKKKHFMYLDFGGRGPNSFSSTISVVINIFRTKIIFETDVLLECVATIESFWDNIFF